MKLQIKTLNKKSLLINIEETKTVYELKMELTAYPDVDVKPEFQKLIYAGKTLNNNEQLCACNIDEKKFLVLMILKQPLTEPTKTTGQSEQNSKAEETAKKKDKHKANDDTAESAEKYQQFVEAAKDVTVQALTNMGYPEPEARKALEASFYNAERAIEYLVDGMPGSSFESDNSSGSAADLHLDPSNLFRHDPLFQTIRKSLRHDPSLYDAAVRKLGETHPDVMDFINEHGIEFVELLAEFSDSDDIPMSDED